MFKDNSIDVPSNEIFSNFFSKNSLVYLKHDLLRVCYKFVCPAGPYGVPCAIDNVYLMLSAIDHTVHRVLILHLNGQGASLLLFFAVSLGKYF